MGDSSNKSKQQWNAKHYTQVKISADPELASAFKKKCAAANVSMASAISRLMRGYCNAPAPKKTEPDYTTRRKRRVAVASMLQQLELIRDAEEEYKENIPENLQASSVNQNAEDAIEALEDAIEKLELAY